MDGENNGSKPYEQMDDLIFGGFSQIFGKHPGVVWLKGIQMKFELVNSLGVTQLVILMGVW